MEPFLTNKNGLTNNDILIIQNDTTISYETQLTELFNDHYINIVEKSSGIKPTAITDINGSENREILLNILHKYKDLILA